MSNTHHQPIPEIPTEERHPRRIRHEIRFRLLEVQHVEPLTPSMLRVTLKGDELEGFYSPGFDDHIKLFFPASGEEAPPRPEVSEKGVSFPEGVPRPVTRDFTPRHYDPVAQTLQIDFALHDTGPASDWARQASPGQLLGVAGPRGSFLFPMDFDWHLLIGDETALPAIARRLAEFPAGTRAIVVAAVDGSIDEISFKTEAEADIHWVHRSTAREDADLLVAALSNITFPKGDFYAWVACESASAKSLREVLIAEHGAHPKWVRASGYWRRGGAGVHDNFNE